MSKTTKVVHNLLGPWAIYEPMQDRIVDTALRAEPPKAYYDEDEPDTPEEPVAEFEIHDGIAVIAITGPIVKYESFLTRYWGYVSSVAIRRQLQAARLSDAVKAVILAIDSPGGMVAGTQELADAVAATDKVKPVYAFISDLGASAAYWPAAQARLIGANRLATIGSIGVRTILLDSSKAYEDMGYKVISIASGKYKDVGLAGKPVSKDDVAEVQREIESLNDLFVDAVAKGRDLSEEKTRELADGRVHVAIDAKKRRLIDKVINWADFVKLVAKEAGIETDPDQFELRSTADCAWRKAEAPQQARATCELRNVATAEVSEDRKVISGYAVKWGELSVPLRRRSDGAIYRERFLPGAFTEALASNPDVVARVDHQGGLQTIGRTDNGTLLLREDDVGLHYEIRPPPTQAGRDATTLIDAKYLKGSSFGFDATGGDRWFTERGGLVREVSECWLLDDVSPTDRPAFLGSTAEVETRSHSEAETAVGESETSGDDGAAADDTAAKPCCSETLTLMREVAAMRN